MIGWKAELPFKKRFHQVLEPFHNSMQIESIRYLNGCAHMIISSIGYLAWNRFMLGERASIEKGVVRGGTCYGGLQVEPAPGSTGRQVEPAQSFNDLRSYAKQMFRQGSVK
jgi:hypothetical protein